MRFSESEELIKEEKIREKAKVWSKTKFFLNKKALLFVLVLLIILFSPFMAGKIKEKFFLASFSGKISPTDYYAVFLDNSQVYFGRMIGKSADEITLSNVYYLQASNQDNTNFDNQHFTLIKLGQELHGPTDEMMINTAHVVFYEKLREDSKVVESIKSQ